MTVKGLIMSVPMVRAILREIEAPGTGKSQTRRVLSPQPVTYQNPPSFVWGKFSGEWPDDWFGYGNEIDGALPYAPGDLLYVREAWRTEPIHDPVLPRDVSVGAPLLFECDDPSRELSGDIWGKYRHARFMCRWMSRITLEVTAVKVERLQDISEVDAKAEGVEPPDEERYEPDWAICPQCGGTGLYDAVHPSTLGVMPDSDCEECDTHKKRFKHLWTSINTKPGTRWEDNPWVCAISFKPYLQNVDAFLAEREAA